MEITRWEMKILKRLLKRIQRLERMNVDVNSLPPSRSFWWLEGNDLAVQMYRRGMGFWRLGNLWKKMKPHKATGEFLRIGGGNLMIKARLMNLNSKEHNWNPMPNLESLSILLYRHTMRIRSKDDAKVMICLIMYLDSSLILHFLHLTFLFIVHLLRSIFR